MSRTTYYADRVLMTSTTTGTGDMSLSDTPVPGFRTVSGAFGAADGDIFDYAAFAVDVSGTPTGDYEIGQAVLTHGTPDTIERRFVYRSSNGGDGLVDWAAGTKRISLIVPSAKAKALKITPGSGEDVFYVRTTGTASGQGNDSGDPVTTPEIAFDRMADYDFTTPSNTSASVDIGAGTFSTGIFNFNIPVHGPRDVTIVGDGSSTTTVQGLQFSADKPCTITISDMTLTDGVIAGRNVTITLGADVVLGNGAGTYGIATDGGSLSVGSGTNVTTLSGNVSVGFLSWSGYVGIEEIDIPSGVTVSEAFVKCTHRGDVEVVGLVKTGAGSVTGPRYLVERFGTIDATGMGSTIIPGSTSGSVASGGQYLP